MIQTIDPSSMLPGQIGKGPKNGAQSLPSKEVATFGDQLAGLNATDGIVDLSVRGELVEIKHSGGPTTLILYDSDAAIAPAKVPETSLDSSPALAPAAQSLPTTPLALSIDTAFAGTSGREQPDAGNSEIPAENLSSPSPPANTLVSGAVASETVVREDHLGNHTRPGPETSEQNGDDLRTAPKSSDHANATDVAKTAPDIDKSERTAIPPAGLPAEKDAASHTPDAPRASLPTPETISLAAKESSELGREPERLASETFDASRTFEFKSDPTTAIQGSLADARHVNVAPGHELGAANIGATTNTVVSSTASPLPPNAPALTVALPQDIPAIVSESLKAEDNGRDRITIQLDPPELGRVSIDFKFDPQGLQTVTVTGETPEALRRLRSMHVELIQALQDNGLSGNSLSFGDGAPDQNQAQTIIFTERATQLQDTTVTDSDISSVSNRKPLRLLSKDGLDLKL